MPDKIKRDQLVKNLERAIEDADDRFSRADQIMGILPQDNKPRRKPGPKPLEHRRLKKLIALIEKDFNLFDELQQRCVDNKVLPPNYNQIAGAAIRLLAMADTKTFLEIIEEVKNDYG